MLIYFVDLYHTQTKSTNANAKYIGQNLLHRVVQIDYSPEIEIFDMLFCCTVKVERNMSNSKQTK